ncbi:PH domain-containing protein [Bacillus lacus]|uniref:PH domain-containing protein n=1 Tax=Metabacillus lacus TaxID=1983721 RepID=A0A7X2LX21_9BACI|nr:PH domain-containing protein [Metabacillus lacus]MRX72095.1 PH domain-containing protein [Metabacillus lacus]
MSEPKRMHPAAVLLNIFKLIKDLIIPILLLLIVNGGGAERLYGGYVLLILLAVLVIFSVIKWLTFTYRIEESELRIEHGLFVKRKRYIPIERIQTVNTSAGIIQQIFGLVKLQVETAGGGLDAEAVLTAISREDARKIAEELEAYKTDFKSETADLLEEGESTSANEKRHIYKLSKKDLLLAATTSSGIGVVLSALFALFSQIDNLIPFDAVADRFSFLTNAGVAVFAVIAFTLLIIAWVLSIAGVLLKYADFTLERKDKDLIISRGLLEKHQLTIPLERIQALKISENLLRQPLGFAALQIISAGGDSKEEGTTMMVPIIRKSAIPQFLEEYLPGYTFPAAVQKLPSRSLRRYIIRAIIPVLPFVAGALYFLRPWGYLSLLLVILACVVGYAKFKDAGWSIHGEQLSIRSRTIGRSTVAVTKRRMQVFHTQQALFQKRADLATIKTSTMSGFIGAHFSLSDVEAEDSEQIRTWYRDRV